MALPDHLLLASLLILAGCQTARDQSVAPSPFQLAGTSWMLIQQGPVGDADQLAEVAPNVYTMALDRDGNAQFTLDCNTGTGRWQGTPAGANGSLTFGPIAATAKLCAPESIGRQIAADLHGSIPYSIYDGRLTMRTRDPSRIYVWDSID